MKQLLPALVVLAVITSVTVLAALGVVAGADAERVLESVLAGAIGGGALHLSLRQ